MSRKPSGSLEAIQHALSVIQTTESAADIRRALAVALPVLHGLSLKETAEMVGRSETWVAKERRAFIREEADQAAHQRQGGRRNQLIPAEEEEAFVESVCQQYIDMHSEWYYGGRSFLPPWFEVRMKFVAFAHLLLEDRIQRKTTRTTVYNLLARVGKSRFVDYEPFMWQQACTQLIPRSVGPSPETANTIAERFGYVRKRSGDG